MNDRFEILTAIASGASVVSLILTIAGAWQASSLAWNVAATALWFRYPILGKEAK